MSFVYLLLNREGDAFKIGVSLNPAQRGAQLPHDLDWSKSLQVPMAGGNAYKVEKLLHYLFRDHSREMPTGDGYTEWFSIGAWGGVLAFLAEQRDRLGIGGTQPVDFLLPKSKSCSEAAWQSKAEKLAEKVARQGQERMARQAANAKHNRSAIESLSHFLSYMQDIGAMRGILVYDELRSGERRAVMYLKGSSRAYVQYCDHRDFQFFDDARSSGTCVFPESFIVGDERSSIAQLSVTPDFLGLREGWFENLAVAATVRALLLPFVGRDGEQRCAELVRLHRFMNERRSRSSAVSA
jgi:hypothetical protein